ncbi:MAG: LLM class flavin-dependent oxidoreductase, partial [Aestuariivirgaceae bacterium]
VDLVTSVVVLPLHDMRVYAGEVVMADILCDGRLVLGVGRGAFGYEMERMGCPLKDSREKFDESLDVLQALLTKEEVSWDGKYYKFDPLTIMPRPLTQPMPRIMMGAVTPEAIYHSTLRGFHIQTTPLQNALSKMLEQVDAFKRAKAELGSKGDHLTLSLSRIAFIVHSEAERRAKLELAYEYYKRFDNVSTGPGLVKNGNIETVPRAQTIEEMAGNLLICTPDEMIDKLAPYAEAGVDEMILSMNIGADQSETIDAMHCIAEEIMPHFNTGQSAKVA